MATTYPSMTNPDLEARTTYPGSGRRIDRPVPLWRRLWDRITRISILGSLCGWLTGRQFRVVPDGPDECQDSDVPHARAELDFVRANEEHSRAIREREAVRQQVQATESALREARARQQEAEENERKGTRPVIWPTAAEIDATKARLHYTEGLLHVAISGIAGSGRSSLANALRGLRNSDRGAALTGVADLTMDEVARFPDPKRPCVWYDIPGAGTLSVPDWKYFTDQGLYIFDRIIVLFDARLTETDIAILRNAARFKISTYIVRSKTLQHIRNVAADSTADDSEGSEDESEDASGLTLERARETYIRETRANIEENLKTAELPQQRVYLVDKDILVRVVKGKPVKGAIDELALLQDIMKSITVTRARPEA